MTVTPNTLLESEYWISPDALTIVLNALDNPQYLQVSLLAGSVITAYRLGVIDYDASLNFRKWTLQAYNNFFDRTDRAYVYAQLDKEGDTALIIYSYDILPLTETITSDTRDSREVYNVYLATISPAVNSLGESVFRMWETDFKTGDLNTDKNIVEGGISDWAKMFRLNKVTDMIEVLKDMTSAVIHKIYVGSRKILINDVKRSVDEDKSLEDSDTIIPTAKYLKNSTESKFHRKDKTDINPFLQKFLKGIELGEYIPGLLGSGAAVQIDDNGNSHAEFDYLTVRKIALFIELIIQEAKHVGGMLVVSPSGMTISRVEETDTAYRCYFERTDGDRVLQNQFTVGTQARRQTFNLTEQSYYWRLVTAVGDDWADLSKTDCDTGSTIPKAGDEVVGLGHRTDKTRQSAIIISAYGSDSPSIKYYQGIDSYDLNDKAVKMDYYDPVSGRFKSVTYGDTYIGDKDEKTYVKYDQENGVEVKGRVKVDNGSTGAGNFTDLPDEIVKAVKIGGENLLRNTGFTGDYTDKQLSLYSKLTDKTKLYSENLIHWSGEGQVSEDSESVTGFACTVGNIEQKISLIQDETYTVSYKAKGSTITIECGGTINVQNLSSDYGFYTFSFINKNSSEFSIRGDATVCEIKLERGTVHTDWCPSVLDSPSVADRFKHFWYLQDAMKGSTDIIGGLILSTMIQLGKYTDGVMEKVNAGISGICNDNQDVAFWAGGNFEQAIKTVQKLMQGNNPTDEEWNDMAKFVATHGGDVFLKGYVYAMGGVFRGTVFAQDGEFNGKVSIGNGNILLNKDGSGKLAGGNISWDSRNTLTIKSLLRMPFTGLTGYFNSMKGEWLFDIASSLNDNHNNFWLNMDDEYGLGHTIIINFPYKNEWAGTTVMIYNQGLSQPLKTKGTDFDGKELLPSRLYEFTLIATEDKFFKWYGKEF